MCVKLIEQPFNIYSLCTISLSSRIVYMMMRIISFIEETKTIKRMLH